MILSHVPTFLLDLLAWNSISHTTVNWTGISPGENKKWTSHFPVNKANHNHLVESLLWATPIEPGPELVWNKPVQMAGSSSIQKNLLKEII